MEQHPTAAGLRARGALVRLRRLGVLVSPLPERAERAILAVLTRMQRETTATALAPVREVDAERVAEIADLRRENDALRIENLRLRSQLR